MSEAATADITAVVATHDRPRLVRRALKSIADQTVAIREVIVVFDRSDPDPTLTEEFPGIDLKLVSNERSPGLTGARNTGILAAKGSWVAFLDDDDEWTREKVQLQASLLTAEAEFVAGGIEIRYGDKSVVRTPGRDSIDFERLLVSRVMEAHSSTFVLRRDALLGDLGLIDERIPGSYYEDYEILLRAAKRKPVSVIDRPVAVIHWGSPSFFKDRWQITVDAIEYLFERYPELTLDRRGWSRLLGQQTFALAGMGARRSALDKGWKTLRLNPLNPRPYLALLVGFGVPPERLIAFANSFGRGI